MNRAAPLKNGCVTSMLPLKKIASRGWQLLRNVSGDDAYELYLEHWRIHHANEGIPPLARKAFFKAEQDRKWNGVRRCC